MRALAAAAAAIACAPPAAAQTIALEGQTIALEGQTIALQEEPAQGALVRGVVPAGAVGLSLDGRPVRLDPEGRFVAGFDRDHGGSAMFVARHPDGREVRRRVEVRPRRWRIEHINVARRPSAATPEYLRVRRQELGRIAAARARDEQSDGWRQRFIWPVAGRISGLFGSQRIYRGEPASFHSGVDVAPGAGARVVAPADGVVVLAGPPTFSLEGNLVILDHGMGLNSAFLHLATTAVSVGQRVRQGQPIGTVGATGRATGPHLHWSMRWNDARIDPQPVAGPMR